MQVCVSVVYSRSLHLKPPIQRKCCISEMSDPKNLPTYKEEHRYLVLRTSTGNLTYLYPRRNADVDKNITIFSICIRISGFLMIFHSLLTRNPYLDARSSSPLCYFLFYCRQIFHDAQICHVGLGCCNIGIISLCAWPWWRCV